MTTTKVAMKIFLKKKKKKKQKKRNIMLANSTRHARLPISYSSTNKTNFPLSEELLMNQYPFLLIKLNDIS